MCNYLEAGNLGISGAGRGVVYLCRVVMYPKSSLANNNKKVQEISVRNQNLLCKFLNWVKLCTWVYHTDIEVGHNRVMP